MKNRLQESKKVLGSEAFITIVSSRATKKMFDLLWRKILLFEKSFSRFDVNSELSAVNMSAGSTAKVSKKFVALAQTAIYYSNLTNGLFNPLILPVLQKAGYKAPWPKPNGKINSGINFSDRKQHKVTSIKINQNTITIPKDSALDFGGIGKGYLLDILASTSKQHKYHDFWISLGGDIICSGFDQGEKPWKIDILDALDNTKTVTNIFSNKNGDATAVATSGITKRRGDNWHHIIDPRTKKPVKTDLLTATVVANSGVEADIYAKIMIIVGSQEALKLAKKNGLRVWLQKSQNTNIKQMQYNWIDNV